MAKFDKESGEWQTGTPTERQEMLGTYDQDIQDLRSLYSLHQELDEEGFGWGIIKKQTRERLIKALQADEDGNHKQEIARLRGEE